jgi:hypothetical protein
LNATPVVAQHVSEPNKEVHMAPEAPREQEQSIKARKKELFDPESHAAEGPLRPFAEYVRVTQASPFSGTVNLVLWGLLALVALLFLASLVTAPASRGKVLAPHSGER